MEYIIKAEIEDLDSLAELFDMYRVFYGKASDIKKGQEFIEQRIVNNDSAIFISIDADKITGFVQLYPIFSSTRMQRLLLLNDLFVLPEFRGYGISKKLIEKCKEYCKDIKACGLVLETAKTNDIGNSLYPKVDFELDDESNYYSWDATL